MLEFWGDYHFLSNFHWSDVKMQGEVYPTVEHAYQASKSSDQEYRRRVRDAWQPGIAKKMGRVLQEQGGVDPEWWDRRLWVMYTLVDRKFQIPDLRVKLMATGGVALVEGNWWGDDYWGVCRGKGHNWLGRILMAVRNGVPFEAMAGV